MTSNLQKRSTINIINKKLISQEIFVEQYSQFSKNNKMILSKKSQQYFFNKRVEIYSY